MPRHRAPLLASLWLVFFVNGSVLASWAPRIPEVVSPLGLTDAQTGTALLGIALGSIPTMALTARCIRTLSPVTPCVSCALLFPVALPLVSYAAGPGGLLMALSLLGVLSGGLDVSMNVLGARLQSAWGTRVIGRLQGAYSLGVLTGTTAAALAVHRGVPVREHFWIAAGLLILMAAAASPGLLAGFARETRIMRATPPQHAPASYPKRHLRIPPPLLLLTMGGFLAEGLITDWSAILLRRDLGASAATGATALTLFSAAMFASRSLSDGLLSRCRDSRFLVVAGGCMTVVSAAARLTGDPMVTALALPVIGLCIGPIFPLALSRGTRVLPGRAAHVAAHLSILGYAAHLGGPPTIGYLAELVGLPRAFPGVLCVVAVLFLLVSLGFRELGRGSPRGGHPDV